MTISAVASTAPTIIPAAAARAVRRVHQMPSRNVGQNVLAAIANAQPTRIEISIPCANRATMTGMIIVPTAAIRKRSRRRATPRAGSRTIRGHTS